MGITPKVVFDVIENPFRKFFVRIVTNKRFEVFTLTCIILNTIVLSVCWYSEP